MSLSREHREKFLEMQDYLVRIAHNIARNSYQGADPDDLLSEMNVYILERAEREPAFLNQQPGYISRAAGWAARDYCSPKRHAGSYGWDKEAFSLDAENEDGTDPAEVFAADLTDDELAISVREVLNELNGTARQVAGLMLLGANGAEIARELGTSRQNVSYYRRQIREALAPVHAQAA